jgi:hypothetical protein
LLFVARDTELNQLKALVEQLAEKVNARGDTPAERLAAVEHRVDEVATHGVRLGTTLGLAAMATHTNVDYSTRPRGFRGGVPEDIDEIELILERLDGHGDAIAKITHPQSVLNKGRSNGLGISRHVQFERLVQLGRNQYWWLLHVLLDLIESLLLFVAPNKLLIFLYL